MGIGFQPLSIPEMKPLKTEELKIIYNERRDDGNVESDFLLGSEF